MQQYAKVSKQITADLSKEKLKCNLLDFCKISFIFDWGYKNEATTAVEFQSVQEDSFKSCVNTGQHLLFEELKVSVLEKARNTWIHQQTGTKSVISKYINVNVATACNWLKISPVIWQA